MSSKSRFFFYRYLNIIKFLIRFTVRNRNKGFAYEVKAGLTIQTFDCVPNDPSFNENSESYFIDIFR